MAVEATVPLPEPVPPLSSTVQPDRLETSEQEITTGVPAVSGEMTRDDPPLDSAVALGVIVDERGTESVAPVDEGVVDPDEPVGVADSLLNEETEPAGAWSVVAPAGLEPFEGGRLPALTIVGRPLPTGGIANAGDRRAGGILSRGATTPAEPLRPVWAPPAAPEPARACAGHPGGDA
jgi:hypothetical protein